MKSIIQVFLLSLLFSTCIVAEESVETDKVFIASLNSSKKDSILRLKKLPDQKLVSLLKLVQSNVDKNDMHVWSFAGTVFNELSMRLWSKLHKKQHEAFRQFIIQHSNLCISRREYALETAGMFDKKSNKVFHPYPYNKMSKKLIKKWHHTSTDKSLDDYILSYMPKSEIKYLKNHSVKYLSPSEHKKYQVTFVKGQIKIGGKTPWDGTYIYALGFEKNTAVLLAGFKEKGRLQHTSFFAGAPVLSVGEFTIENKKLVSLRSSSGHYHPELKHMQAMVDYLKQDDHLGERAASKIHVRKHK